MKKFSLGKLAAALAASAMVLTAAFTGCSSSSSSGGDDGEGTIESVSITSSAADEAVDSGTEVTLTAAVTGDISAENVTYTWEIAENPGNLTAALSEESGNPVTLTVTNEDESAHEIKVKVTASNKNDSENSKTAEVSVTVKGKNGSEDVPEEEKKTEENQNPTEETKTPVLDSVSISGTQKIASNGTGNLTAAAKGTNLENASINYSWTIEDGGDYAEISGNGASAEITGKDSNDAEQTVKVKVTAKLGETSVTSEEYSVTIAAKGTEVKNEITGLTASASAETVDPGKTVTLTASPMTNGTPTIAYSWKITDGDDYAEISGNGASVTLTAKNEDSESHTVKVTVAASDGTNEKTAEVSVTVNADTTPVIESVSISGEKSIDAAGSATLTATPSGKNLENASIAYTWTIASGSSYASVSGNGASATIKGKNTTASEQSVKVKVTAKAGASSVTSEEYPVTVAAQKTGDVSVNVTLNDVTTYFTVKFVDATEEGYTSNETKTYKIKSGEKVTDKIPNWTHEGSLLVWTSDVGGVTTESEITQDVTFTASWSSAHTVTFKDSSAYEDDTVKEDVSVEVADGAAIDASKIPSWTKTHYTLGWKNGDTEVDVSAITSAEVTADVTYTAVWTENAKFTVTFKDSDSSNGNADETQKVYSGEKASVPSWNKDNYTLSWSSSSTTVTSPSDAITENVTFTAEWTELPKCSNCGTHYDTQAEADACKKKSGCPNYGKVTLIALVGSDGKVISGNSNVTVNSASVNSNTDNGAIELTYDGTTYKTVKLESKSSIVVTATAGQTITVVGSLPSGTKNCFKVGTNSYKLDSKTTEVTTFEKSFTSTGSDTITKGDKASIALIIIQ